MRLGVTGQGLVLAEGPLKGAPVVGEASAALEEALAAGGVMYATRYKLRWHPSPRPSDRAKAVRLSHLSH